MDRDGFAIPAADGIRITDDSGYRLPSRGDGNKAAIEIASHIDPVPAVSTAAGDLGYRGLSHIKQQYFTFGCAADADGGRTHERGAIAFT